MTQDRNLTPILKQLSHGILSYFGHIQNYLQNKRKPENNSLIRYNNTKDIMINHKGTRMVKDGED